MRMDLDVKLWEQKVIIPTYGTGKKEKNPMFLEKRIYQGSSGAVYPYPVIEKILDGKKDETYTALFLENQYLRIMILPELGGRVHMAYDKIKQRHFIYYNQVIKPALVGLTGPWISGGIEFNWPQHHRPSTFEPIDYSTQENSDGSKTIWVSEVERMNSTKGMAGFTLYPDKAYLEVNVKLFNRTPFPQTFLWWANPAVKVNDHYQSIFPPDVHAVFDHGKRDVSEFPIAKGTYYKVDYSRGVDISRYKNIPVPTSYMAARSKYDFIGGYEHDTSAGMLHVADHHISPGKKQWTWGNGEFGRAWDKNLTDDDGPYVELMVGVFTDNQPDFSWISPYEERSFSQYFMPYSDVGVVKNATKDAMVNLEVSDKEVLVLLYATAVYKDATVQLTHEGQTIWEEKITIAPALPYKHVQQHSGILQHYAVKLSDAGGRVLVAYQPEVDAVKSIPPPANAPLPPKEIASVEELYLTGLHIEQYRHATFQATDYYAEALKREPDDVRTNTAMGLWLLRRGQFKRAEDHFNRAIRRLTERNPNPYDCEPFYHLGIALMMQGKNELAYNILFRCTWSAPWQDAAYLQLARLASIKEDYNSALEFVNRSLLRNQHNQTARHLKCSILRKLGLLATALSLARESVNLDPFSMGCHFEIFLILSGQGLHEQAEDTLLHIKRTMRGNVHHYIEYACDYFHCGLYVEATEFLWIAIGNRDDAYPMLYYYLGYLANKIGNTQQAQEYCAKASKMKPDYCFPNRIEDVSVLQFATSINQDAKAHFYLGNYWYANRQHEKAVTEWENSVFKDQYFPTAHRNLALAYHNKRRDSKMALEVLERAFSLDTSDARVLMELDQLHKRLNTSHAQRLRLLEENLILTEERDDLYLERIILCNLTDQFEKAKDLLAKRNFHPWEGGEGKVTGQHVICYVEIAKKYYLEGNFHDSLDALGQAEHYPPNLGEGKLFGTRENDILYLKGCIYDRMGQHEQAEECYKLSCKGETEPGQAHFYNDPQPDKLFYIGLSLQKLDHSEKAKALFRKLIEYGADHLSDKVEIDYFAVSLPDLLVFEQDLSVRNQIHCHYMMGLGYLGLGENKKAQDQFNHVLELDINHQGALIHKKFIKSPFSVENNGRSQFVNGELKHK